MNYQKLLGNPIKSLGRAFWQTLYPPYCLHCDYPLEGAKTLCYGCQILLERADPTERCQFCFSSEKGARWRMCRDCYQKPLSINGFASVFDDIGPASDLIRQFYRGKTYLAESLGGFIIEQWVSLSWPVPDVVVPVASSFSNWFKQGHNPEGLLAKEVARILQVPLVEALKRESYHTELPRFRLRNKAELKDAIVLLINGRYDTGKTICAAAEGLRGGAPAKIYGMSVTRRMG